MGSDYEMSYKYKLKLLFLKDILERYTDADHGLTHAELTVKLREWGIKANDRTLRDDLVALQEYADRMGLELTDNIRIDEGKEKAHPIRYMLRKRLFTSTEVKLLMECVRSLHSLSEKRTEMLLEKLTSLCSAPEAAQIRKEFAVTGGSKAYWHNGKREEQDEAGYRENEWEHDGNHDVLLCNIERIDRAIRENKKIEFRYFWFNMNKMPTYPRDPKHRHTVSPCVRVLENGRYYLIVLDEKNEYKHFRLERMTDIRIIEEERVVQKLGYKSWEEYVNAQCGIQSKYRFKRGIPYGYRLSPIHYNTYHVRMRFTRDMVGEVLDRFGQDVRIYKEDKGHFVAEFKVQYNPQFVEWVLGMGNKVKILEDAYMGREIRGDISMYAKGMANWHSRQ